MKSEEKNRFKFTQGRLFDHNEPGLLMTPVLRDRQGAEYIAHCPQQYEVLDFFDSGRHWRVSKVVKKHSRQRYLLKNLIDESNFNECYSLAGLQGSIISELCDEFVSVPKVIEAGYRSDGANYIIEEEKFGLHATPAVLNSLTKREQADFCAHLAVFLERLHNSAPAFAKGRKLCPDVTMSRTYADSNYFVRLIYQYYSFQSPSLIHGDLAPRNVLLDVNKGVINVIDWGNACCDYPFAEFDKMYSDMYPFGRNISNAIADKYCQLREARYVVEQRQAAETIKSRNSAKQSAKPDRTCRLPMSMRSGGHTR